MLIEGLALNKVTYYHSPEVFRINKVNKQIQIRKAFFTYDWKKLLELNYVSSFSYTWLDSMLFFK